MLVLAEVGREAVTPTSASPGSVLTKGSQNEWGNGCHIFLSLRRGGFGEDRMAEEGDNGGWIEGCLRLAQRKK